MTIVTFDNNNLGFNPLHLMVFELLISILNYNTTQPLMVSNLTLPGYSKGIAVSGDDIAFVANDDCGVQIVDVTSDFSPKIIKSLDINGSVYDLKIRNHSLFVFKRETDLVSFLENDAILMYDISSILNPVFIT